MPKVHITLTVECESIEAARGALEAMHANGNTQAGNFVVTTPTPPAPEPAPGTTEDTPKKRGRKAKAEVTPAAQEPASQHTLEQVREAAKAVRDKFGTERLILLFSELGIEKISDLPAEKYGAAILNFQAALDTPA